MQRVFVRFLEEIEDTQKTFRNYLTFSNEYQKLGSLLENLIWKVLKS